MLVALIMISCSKNSTRALSQEQFQQVVDKIPDYPKREFFTKEDQIKIASLPPIFKQWVYEMVIFSKCLKQNKCE